MADEPQAASPTIEDVSDDDFNWGQFFESDEPVDTPPVAAATVQPQAAASEPEGDEEPDGTAALRAQVEELQKIVKETSQVTTEIATKNRVSAAVEAWKQQASPVELSMADVLTEATSLEDLKVKADLIKRVSQSSDKVMEKERLKIEQDLQRQFGLPVTPSFQPIANQDKMQEKLAEGDIDAAASIALKGFFS